jgi:hypothetical protein
MKPDPPLTAEAVAAVARARAAAVAQGARRAELRPFLMRLLVAALISLTVGVGVSAFLASRQSAAADPAKGYLPAKEGTMASGPVPFALWSAYCEAAGLTDHGGAVESGGTVRKVSALQADQFCRWLTVQYPLPGGLRYALPSQEMLTASFAAGLYEWTSSGEPAGPRVMRLGADPVNVHAAHRDPAFTFRVALVK